MHAVEWGESTDEDVIIPKTVHRPKERLHDVPRIAHEKALRRRGSFSAYKPSAEHGHHEGPSLGSWVADPTKPIAVTDRSGTKLVYFPPHASPPNRSPSSRNNSGPTSPKARLLAYVAAVEDDETETEEEEGANESFQDTVLGPIADHMFSDFTKGQLRTSGSQSSGMPQAPPSTPVQAVDAHGWTETEDDDDDAGEKHLRIEDLINMGDSEDSEDSEGALGLDVPFPLPSSPLASQEGQKLRVASSSPEPPISASAVWPALHRPRGGGHGLRRDRSHGARSTSGASQTKSSALLTSKIQGAVLSPKRVRSRY